MKIEELADVCQTSLNLVRMPREEGQPDCEWSVSLAGCTDVGEGCSLVVATSNFLQAIRGHEIVVNGNRYYIPTTIEDHYI